MKETMKQPESQKKHTSSSIDSHPLPSDRQNRVSARLLERINRMGAENVEQLSGNEVQELLQDLLIHQAELEIQNEELQRAQEEIEAVNVKYFELYDKAPVGYCTLSPRGEILDANLTFSRLLKIPRHNLAGKPFIRYIFDDHRETYVRYFERALHKADQEQHFELRMKSGVDRFFHAQLSMVAHKVLPKGPEFKVTVNDVTLQKESEDRLRAMFEHMKSGVAIYEARDNGMDFIFRDMNPEAERITRVKRQDVLGRRLLELFPHMDKTGLFDALKKVWKTGESIYMKPFYYKDSVRNGWRENLIFRLPSGEVVAIFDDVTQRIQDQKELVRAREKAESASRAKSEFLANMSHEIRTPLNGIVGMMQMLSATVLNPDQKELVTLGKISAKRLTQLLSDILDLSCIDSGKMVVREKEFSLHEICSSIKDLFMIPAREKEILFNCSLDSSLPAKIIGDDTRLHQILFNLVGNAVKFTDCGSINLIVSPVSRPDTGSLRIMFSVIDTGTGISEDKLDKLFQPFSQADGSMTRQYQGAGLGLVIVRRLASMMDGNISVESQPGQGTTVNVVLPFKMPEEEICQTARQTWQPVRKSDSLNILLAEDDSLNQIFIKRIIEKEGHMVTLAKNGKEVVDMLQEKDFDCILMDIQMPVMTGVEATQLIRAQEAGSQRSGVRGQEAGVRGQVSGDRSRESEVEHSQGAPSVHGVNIPASRTQQNTPEGTPVQPGKHSSINNYRIPIIAVTAHTQPGDRELFLEAGMDDYIGKPVSLEDFQRVFSKFFGEKEIQT